MTDKLHVLYLIARKRWESKMSRGARFHTIEALGRRDDVELFVHGEGWNYGPDVPYDKLDLVIAYKPSDHLAVVERIANPLYRTYSAAALVLVFNEVHDDIIKNDFDSSGASIVVCHHENDVEKMLGRGADVFHIPHCAERSVFWPEHPLCKPGLERPVDCLVTGVQSPEIYPLRAKFRALVDGGALPGEVRKHPGYKLRDAKACEREIRDYAEHLRRSKISLCCTSTRKYALAKIVESMMAGCLVVTDMPDDESFKSTLGRYVVQVEAEWPPDRLARCVKWWLDRPKALDEMRLAGQRLALERFTMERWASDFVEKIRQWQKANEISGA